MPEVFNCSVFLNADEIAAELNPLDVEAAALQAGRIMLNQIDENIALKRTFCIETTLATKSYLNLIRKVQLLGYEVILLFFYLPSVELAKLRVASRVKKGGHNIPSEVVERRYTLGIQNLFKFIKIVDHWSVYKNDISPPVIIAEGEFENNYKIHNLELWESLKKI
ncbi:zeta toxin family protein [Parasediminibacterium sp. JCM 36343]|uniref:zeta toxin family protein n=1 Tax=Parasediminibacterium sp. JCM 36343 TaxID=3374279 RepID=UPI00397997CB